MGPFGYRLFGHPTSLRHRVQYMVVLDKHRHDGLPCGDLTVLENFPQYLELAKEFLDPKSGYTDFVSRGNPRSMPLFFKLTPDEFDLYTFNLYIRGYTKIYNLGGRCSLEEFSSGEEEAESATLNSIYQHALQLFKSKSIQVPKEPLVIRERYLDVPSRGVVIWSIGTPHESSMCKAADGWKEKGLRPPYRIVAYGDVRPFYPNDERNAIYEQYIASIYANTAYFGYDPKDGNVFEQECIRQGKLSKLDLAKASSLVRLLYEGASFENVCSQVPLVKKWRLSDDERKQFTTQGWLVIPEVLGKEQTDQALREIEHCVELLVERGSGKQIQVDFKSHPEITGLHADGALQMKLAGRNDLFSDPDRPQFSEWPQHTGMMNFLFRPAINELVYGNPIIYSKLYDLYRLLGHEEPRLMCVPERFGVSGVGKTNMGWHVDLQMYS